MLEWNQRIVCELEIFAQFYVEHFEIDLTYRVIKVVEICSFGLILEKLNNVLIS